HRDFVVSDSSARFYPLGPPPRATLFPYTTLFRSSRAGRARRIRRGHRLAGHRGAQPGRAPAHPGAGGSDHRAAAVGSAGTALPGSPRPGGSAMNATADAATLTDATTLADATTTAAGADATHGATVPSMAATKRRLAAQIRGLVGKAIEDYAMIGEGDRV